MWKRHQAPRVACWQLCIFEIMAESPESPKGVDDTARSPRGSATPSGIGAFANYGKRHQAPRVGCWQRCILDREGSGGSKSGRVHLTVTSMKRLRARLTMAPASGNGHFDGAFEFPLKWVLSGNAATCPVREAVTAVPVMLRTGTRDWVSSKSPRSPKVNNPQLLGSRLRS